MKRKILVVGSANMDFSMNLYKVPEVGETVIDDGGVAYTPGGKGANAAATLIRLGADCALCAKLGADLHGQKLYNYYKDIGIDTSYIKADHDHSTGLAVVIKEGNGDNRIVVYPGANSFLTTEAVMEAFECCPDAVYIGFEIPFATALASCSMSLLVTRFNSLIAERIVSDIFVPVSPSGTGKTLRESTYSLFFSK